MEKLSRSQTTREGVMQQPKSMHDLRSYSTSAYQPASLSNFSNKVEIKKGNNKLSRISSSSSSKNWSFQMDPELQRKKRVVGYKAYSVEGKMKGSLRKSFRWIKDTCNNVVNGFW